MVVRGHVQLYLKYYREAVSDFDRAEKIKELDADDYTARGTANYLQGEKEKALDDWSKAAFRGCKKAKEFMLNGYPDPE